MYLLYNTTLNVSLQLMQLRPSRNTENPVDVGMVEEGAGLKMSTRSLVKVTEVFWITGIIFLNWCYCSWINHKNK